MDFFKLLNDAVHASYIDKDIKSKEELRAKLLYNDRKKSRIIHSELEKELLNCEEFWFSAAFITEQGLLCLLGELDYLRRIGIRGKILTTDYLEFNTPSMFRKLMSYENIEVKVMSGFHIKGYMFRKGNMRKFIVGSSNLTAKALRVNKEWNLCITSHEDGQIVDEIEREFTELWKDAEELNEEWILNYEEKFRKKLKKERVLNTVEEEISDEDYGELKPNSMQSAAMESMERLRRKGKDKALLISATGTGKTYLSAFDVKKFGPEKTLFLAHREKILKQAMESFKKVLGKDINAGILSGSSKDFSSDYLFSTVNMMSRKDVQEKFSKDEFDYIIIDESHRAAAESYKKIVGYFKPEFLLGMTATPERTDEENVFEIFDYNIAYEIRLKQALEENILCPFHYYGITDIDGREDYDDLRKVSPAERAGFVAEKIEIYSYDNKRKRGLMFCSTVEECKALSEEFNKLGYRTVPLSGEDSEEKREEMIKRLEMEEGEKALDYILSVDILNEGVDIPSLNQIIMLRPTQSPIVFVQQLGRGLRKHKGKEYLLVLDFIANYRNNYMIPIALSGDRSYTKDNLRKFTAEANKSVPGISTINFDPISKKRIYASLDKAKFNSVSFLRNEYTNLKNKIGRIPHISDFERHGTVEVLKYFDKFGSYHDFLVKYEKEYEIEFSERENQFINYFSQKIANGKRIHEILLIKLIIDNIDSDSALMTIRDIFNNKLKKEYGIIMDEKEEKSVFTMLTNQFLEANPRKKFTEAVYLSGSSECYFPSREFKDALRSNDKFKLHMKALVNYSEKRYCNMYSNRYKGTNLELYRTYSYEDICRLLNWEKDLNGGSIGGYKYDEYTNTFPVFINYHKCDDSIAYHDRFIDRNNIIALSKSSRKTDSKDAMRIYGAKENGTKIYLFVRKNKEDKDESGKEFYFLGEVEASGNPVPVEIDNKPAFEINYRLEEPVKDDIYDYIKEESLES